MIDRIEELRAAYASGCRTDAIGNELFDIIRSLRAEVQRLSAELDSANADAEGAESLISNLRTNLQEKIAQVQRLTEEARRVREIEVSEECYGMLTAHGSDGTMLVCGEFKSGREFREKYRVAHRSDAGRVEVPELRWIHSDLVGIFFTEDSGGARFPTDREKELLGRLRDACSRLSPSPQPATGAVVEVPDVAIPMGTALQRLGARLADLLDDEAFNNIEANYLIPAIRELETAPQPSADVVVVPREEWEATSRDSKQLKDCVQEFERLKDATMKDEKIPFPARVRDSLYLDGVLAVLTTNHAAAPNPPPTTKRDLCERNA